MQQWGETTWMGVLWWILFLFAIWCIAPDLAQLLK